MFGSEGYSLKELTSGGSSIVDFASRIAKLRFELGNKFLQLRNPAHLTSSVSKKLIASTMELNSNSDPLPARIEHSVPLPVYEIVDQQRDSKNVIKFCLLLSAILITGLLVCLWARN